MNVYACIGDIVGSKKIKDRQSFQQDLQNLLKQCNERYQEQIVSNLTLTLGDEFQGLFKDAMSVLLVMDVISLSLEIEGYNIRFGFSYGEISTSINRELSIGADGEGFWFAREAIEKVHHKHYSQKVNERFKSQSTEEDDLINSILQVQNALRKSWTKSQKELVLTTILNTKYETMDNEYLKNTLNISAQNLSNRSGAASVAQYLNSRKRLGQYIEKVIEYG